MAVTTSLVFITWLCMARDFVFCDDYEEIGKDITLTPSIRGKPTDIRWTHNENMVLSYDGREVEEYASFKHRVVVDFETGQLTIKKLTSQDSGQYQSEIVINGKVQTSSHTVTVLDVLPEPQVTCEPGETSDVKKLLCSVESQTQLSYEWSGLNIKVHSGSELLVEEQEENRDSVYTCTVKNQANSRSTDFTLTDCHTGRAGTDVLVPVIIIPILLLILLIPLGVFLYRRKEKSRQSGLKKMDPENGEGHSLMRNYQKDVMPGSSEATLPSHARLPPQNQSIIDQKWDQANEAESSGEANEEHTPLKETLKQSPQSAVSDTDQEDTESGNKGELDKNVKNREHAVEAEENTDETEKERDKQRLEEEEKENRQTEESGNEEEFPEHQNERKTEDNSEDNQTPAEKEETKDRGHTETVSPQPAVTERNNMDSENEAEQQHTHEKRRSEERSAEQTNESMWNQGTTEADNSEDDTGEEENLDGIGRTNTAEACVRPAVDRSLDGEALGSPADSPANPEMNSSESSSIQTDQDPEEERKRPGQEQEQMTEDKNHDQETQSCKQTDSDSAINSVCQRRGRDDESSIRDEDVQTHTLKQSPQSAVSDTDQEDTESGNEGELDKSVKNSEHAVEAEENTDETENERDKQRLEEEERENRQTEESGNEEEFPEHQNERKTEDNSEDNQTTGEKEETKDRGHTDSPANPEKKPMNSRDSSSIQTDRVPGVRELAESEPDVEETV